MSVSHQAANGGGGGGMMGGLDNALEDGEEPTRTLADIIFEKMGEQDALEAADGSGVVKKRNVDDGGPPDPREGLNPKVVEVYQK